MIFYFSGTGNSLYAAKSIGEYNKERLIAVASAMRSNTEILEYTLSEDEIIGFVYPVYAWGPPKMVMDFINKLKLNNYKDNYIFSVATCGENIGNTMELLDKCLKKRKMSLKSGFSIKMPNNYVIMGNVDKKEKAENKLKEAEEVLKSINTIIKERKENVFLTEKGFMPGIMTSAFNPLFTKMGISTKNFYASDNCTGCRICESVCNCRSIKVDGKPVWSKVCSQCLACLHYCPVKAIQFGKGTERKGRYTHRDIRLDEMKIR